mmetsp:Transcript_25992/g.68202  ORF Transcript_25992/g.68202 Transcript_25992/m.68202 type:complete len:290 (-) Transcript_25992:911-1780(-)
MLGDLDLELWLVLTSHCAGAREYPLEESEWHTFRRSVPESDPCLATHHGRHVWLDLQRSTRRPAGRLHVGNYRARGWGEITGNSWRWHARDPHIPAVHKPALKNHVEVAVKIVDRHPEKAILRFLWVQFRIDQRPRNRNILQSSVVQAWRSTEDLHEEATLKIDSAVHGVGIIGIESHTMHFAIDLVGSTHEESVSLEVIQVYEKAICSDITSLEPASHAPCQISERLLHLTTTPDRLPTTRAHLTHGTHGVDLGVRLLHQRGPKNIGKVLRATTNCGCIVGELLFHRS